MPVFPARDIDSVSWVAGAVVTHLDDTSRTVSATCWSSSRQLNEIAFAFFASVVGGRLEDVDHLRERATSSPAHVFDYCRRLISPHMSPNLERMASMIEAETRLVFHRSPLPNDPKTDPTLLVDRPVEVVIPYRSTPDNPLRARNLGAVLSALEHQTAERSSYQITVVEESDVPTVSTRPGTAVDNYIHVEYTGPFNRALAMNRGAEQAADDSILCLLDGDILPDRDFILRNAARVSQAPGRLHLPYSDMFCLLPGDAAAMASNGYHPGRDYNGYLITHPVGGCVWITREAFKSAGGFDENFKGWGGEDRDFADRADKVAPILRHPELLTHLYHERPAMPSSRKEIMAAAGKTFEGEDQ
ncbi:glycosyltransferase family 2 protein [Streptomyces chiangmaiensis]|uniref:Galactosyltransferase-related protein n=1 Tax=Streptomyces chiangmaiensis TaxID=766497 RepID=A0ABU7G024_9ACTN|nr:galactosyltransferase-related protein [Streptomyces chiangmaiensis]MED7828714.1 galactosyltransferase-related protein [Streptomyces chiangmaiensis]